MWSNRLLEPYSKIITLSSYCISEFTTINNLIDIRERDPFVSKDNGTFMYTEKNINIPLLSIGEFLLEEIDTCKKFLKDFTKIHSTLEEMLNMADELGISGYKLSFGASRDISKKELMNHFSQLFNESSTIINAKQHVESSVMNDEEYKHIHTNIVCWYGLACTLLLSVSRFCNELLTGIHMENIDFESTKTILHSIDS